MDLVTIYDVQNKLISFSGPIPQVVDVITEWGGLYILASDDRVLRQSH